MSEGVSAYSQINKNRKKEVYKYIQQKKIKKQEDIENGKNG